MRGLEATAIGLWYSIALLIGAVAGQNAVVIVDKNGGLIEQGDQGFGLDGEHIVLSQMAVDD